MAVLHNGNTVGNGQSLLLIVCHIDGGDAQPPLQFFDDGTHLHPKLGVQIGKGLIHEQYAGFYNKGTGQRYPLLLAAGKLVGLAVCQMADLHQFQSLVYPGFDLVGGNVPGLEAICYIVPYAEMRKDGVVLKHHADIPLMGGHVVDALVSKIKIAAFNGIEACDHAQKSGFPAAVISHNPHTLPRPDRKFHPVKDVLSVIGFAYTR